MLLFTTIPASATTPVPVMMTEKGWFITSMPISTPAVDRTTASSTSTAL
jgi:hypothetical protein